MAVVAGAGSSRVKWLAGESAREQTTGVWLVSAAVGGVLGLAALGVAYTPALHDGLVVSRRCWVVGSRRVLPCASCC